MRSSQSTPVRASGPVDGVAGFLITVALAAPHVSLLEIGYPASAIIHRDVASRVAAHIAVDDRDIAFLRPVTRRRDCLESQAREVGAIVLGIVRTLSHVQTASFQRCADIGCTVMS